MSVVDLNIVTTPSASPYADQFVVELTFNHDDDSITAEETVVFPAGTDKADVVEFINVLNVADDYIRDHCQEPSDDESEEEVVKGYDKWCNWGEPGLQSWPSDSNGNYFAELESIVVAYYDANGNRFEVEQVEE